MKYFGEETKQDFIDSIYEGELTVFYKDATYDIWLDGRGYCIGMTYFNGKQVIEEEHENSIGSAETVEELIETYIMYDGVKFSEAMEMDHTEIEE